MLGGVCQPEAPTRVVHHLNSSSYFSRVFYHQFCTCSTWQNFFNRTALSVSGTLVLWQSSVASVLTPPLQKQVSSLSSDGSESGSTESSASSVTLPSAQLGDLTWYLGIKATRDRTTRELWLSQRAYIDKVAATFAIQPLTRKTRSPLPTKLSLPPPLPVSNPALTKAFQRRAGSIAYAALATRPDVAHAASHLSTFNRAPSSNRRAHQGGRPLCTISS